MSFAPMKAAIYNWLKDHSGLSADHVVEALQSAPRPSPPYLTYQVGTAVRRVGATDCVTTEGQTSKVSGLRELTVSLNAIGMDALDTMARVRDSLELPSVVELFDAAQMAVDPDGDVKDLSALEETNFQQRAQLDVNVGFSVSADDGSSTIEHVQLTTPYGNGPININ